MEIYQSTRICPWTRQVLHSGMAHRSILGRWGKVEKKPQQGPRWPQYLCKRVCYLVATLVGWLSADGAPQQWEPERKWTRWLKRIAQKDSVCTSPRQKPSGPLMCRQMWRGDTWWQQASTTSWKLGPLPKGNFLLLSNENAGLPLLAVLSAVTTPLLDSSFSPVY